LAETEAWKFVKDLPEGDKFELTTILPGFTLGPPLTPAPGTSVGMMQGLMMGGMPEIPSNHTSVVDVKAVAMAHLQAVKKQKAAGKRFLVCKETMSI
jgi:dihydroflavonol-4-reductase